MEICKKEDPAVKVIEEGRRVRCWLYDGPEARPEVSGTEVEE